MFERFLLPLVMGIYWVCKKKHISLAGLYASKVTLRNLTTLPHNKSVNINIGAHALTTFPSTFYYYLNKIFEPNEPYKNQALFCIYVQRFIVKMWMESKPWKSLCTFLDQYNFVIIKIGKIFYR